MGSHDSTLAALLALIEDYHEFNPAGVLREDEVPSAVAFAKQVSKGLPCVYDAQSALERYRALAWSNQNLIDAVKEEIEVAATPDGRADSLCLLPQSTSDEKVFLQPANINMTMGDFLNKLNGPRLEGDPVFYLQSQNSNLTSTPLEPLLADLPRNFDFTLQVIGEPEAINLWIGDERSVTSTHRDPYENLYVVLRGSKTFTLWPPVDEVCMDAQMVRTGRYDLDCRTMKFNVSLDEDQEASNQPPKIPWVSIDPSQSRRELNQEHPLYQYAEPKKVVVSAGEMLYLPSGWYHHVAQQCGRWDDGTPSPCIAVNYWYDMDYDGEKYVMRQLIGRLTEDVLRRQTLFLQYWTDDLHLTGGNEAINYVAQFPRQWLQELRQVQYNWNEN